MFLGFMSSIPFISAGNYLCCMWILLGGGIAATMLMKQRPGGITFGDGAYVGVLSGVFGAIVGTIVHIPVMIVMSRIFQSQEKYVEDMLQQFQVEGPMRDWMLRIASGEISAATILFTFFLNLVMWSLFAMIGGIIAVALANKKGGPSRTAPTA